MAEKKTVKSAPIEEMVDEENIVVTPDKPKMVEVFLPRASRPDAPKEEFYSYNFKNYLIRRGEKVMVPYQLKEIIEEQMRAESAAFDYAEALKIREPE